MARSKQSPAPQAHTYTIEFASDGGIVKSSGDHKFMLTSPLIERQGRKVVDLGGVYLKPAGQVYVAGNVASGGVRLHVTVEHLPVRQVAATPQAVPTAPAPKLDDALAAQFFAQMMAAFANSQK